MPWDAKKWEMFKNNSHGYIREYMFMLIHNYKHSENNDHYFLNCDHNFVDRLFIGHFCKVSS